MTQQEVVQARAELRFLEQYAQALKAKGILRPEDREDLTQRAIRLIRPVIASLIEKGYHSEVLEALGLQQG